MAESTGRKGIGVGLEKAVPGDGKMTVSIDRRFGENTRGDAINPI
jgi:hypothetical protein